jgi:MinD-like ATPase involved in chromosome partitioning or flagellar assembly
MLDAKDIIEIPEDDKVPESISKGVPLVVYKKGSKASMAIRG